MILARALSVAFQNEALTDTCLLRHLSSVYTASRGGGTKRSRVWKMGLFLKTALVHFSLETSPGVDDILGSSGGGDPGSEP